MVDELTQPAGASAVGDEGQTRQVPQVRFVKFFGKRAAQLKGALGQEIAKCIMKDGHLFGGDGGFKPHGQQAPDIPDGVESAIEVFDFLNGLVHGCGDFEEAEIFRVDQFTSQQLARDEAVPVVPIVAPRSLEADDRLRVALAGLGEGQNLKAFVMRSKAAWEQGNRIGLFLKDQFSREEVFEGDELGIIGNRGIRALLEGQHDVHPEAVFAAGALLTCAHNPVSPSGNDHESFFDDLTGKLEGHLIVGVIRGRAGRSEDADLAPIAVVMEDAEGMAQFFDGPVDDLQVQGVQMGIVKPERSGQEFLHNCGLQVVFRTIEQEANLAE